jgi:hypothetical protein
VSGPVLFLLLIGWFGTTILTVFPSHESGKTDEKADTNPLRRIYWLLSVLILPTAIFWLISSQVGLFEMNLDAFPLEFSLGMAVFWGTGLFLRAWFLRHTPDVETNKAFHAWVEQLKEREARVYLFDKMPFLKSRSFVRVWIPVATGLILLVCAYLVALTFAYGSAPRIASQPPTVWATIALAFAMSQILYWVGQAAFWQLLHEQGTSLPVRYALFGDQVVRFMLSSWMIIFAFFLEMQWDTIDHRDNWMGIVAAVVLMGFMAVVVIPFANWRVRFRDERREQLTRFAFLMNRIENAFKFGAIKPGAAGQEPERFNLVDKPQDYALGAINKSLGDLEALFLDIIRQSRFRCYVALHAHKPERLIALRPAFDRASELYAEWYRSDPARATPHAIQKKQNTGQERAAEDLITELQKLTRNQNPHFTPFESFLVERAFAEKRMRGAHKLGEVPHLSAMVDQHLKRLEESDYRYRIMRWIGRLMTRFDQPAWLLGLAAEARGDMESRLQRVDRRSLLLAVSATVAASVIAWFFAIYDKDIKQIVRDGVDLSGEFSAIVYRAEPPR